MYTNYSSSKIDRCKRDDAAFFGQLLNILESNIQDLVMHTVDREGDVKLF